MYGTLDNLQKYRKKTPHFFWLDAEGFIFAVITIAVPNFQPVLYISTHFFFAAGADDVRGCRRSCCKKFINSLKDEA